MPAGRPEEWTEEVAAAFAAELVEWMKADPEHLFWQTFVVEVKDEAPRLLSWLQQKFREKSYKLDAPELSDAQRVELGEKLKKREEFFDSIKKAEALQELRLSYKAMDNRSVGGAIFILKNKHNWADKQEIKQETRQVNIDGSELASKSLDDLLRLQEELAE